MIKRTNYPLIGMSNLYKVWNLFMKLRKFGEISNSLTYKNKTLLRNENIALTNS